MILDLLKKELSEELYTQVSEALKDKDLGQFIPKARFDEVNVAKKDLEAKYKEATTKLEGYGDYDDLKKKVTEFGDYENLKKQNEELLLNTRKSTLSKLGYDDSFLDYALGKIDPADFENNAKKFIEENPKFAAETFKKINLSLGLGGQGAKKPEDMTAGEYNAWRETHNIDGTPIVKK